MGLTNRGKDISEQRKVLSFSNSQALTAGETGVLSYIPYPCVLQAVQLTAFSIESSPVLLLNVNRFIPGAGYTSFLVGTTFAPSDFGISGMPQGVSLPADGSTLLNLMATDVVGVRVFGGATAGIFGLAGCLVVKPTQDITAYLGLS